MFLAARDDDAVGRGGRDAATRQIVGRCRGGGGKCGRIDRRGIDHIEENIRDRAAILQNLVARSRAARRIEVVPVDFQAKAVGAVGRGQGKGRNRHARVVVALRGEAVFALRLAFVVGEGHHFGRVGARSVELAVVVQVDIHVSVHPVAFPLGRNRHRRAGSHLDGGGGEVGVGLRVFAERENDGCLLGGIGERHLAYGALAALCCVGIERNRVRRSAHLHTHRGGVSAFGRYGHGGLTVFHTAHHAVVHRGD